MIDWRPRESAPKDGSTFLTFSPESSLNGGCDFAKWSAEHGEFCKWGCGWQWVTHWAPLTAPLS